VSKLLASAPLPSISTPTLPPEFVPQFIEAIDKEIFTEVRLSLPWYPSNFFFC
jgi:hypothetical protein